MAAQLPLDRTIIMRPQYSSRFDHLDPHRNKVRVYNELQWHRFSTGTEEENTSIVEDYSVVIGNPDQLFADGVDNFGENITEVGNGTYRANILHAEPEQINVTDHSADPLVTYVPTGTAFWRGPTFWKSLDRTI